MGYMRIRQDGTGILGTNTKVPILEIKEGERISYLSDTYRSRQLPIYTFYKEDNCLLKIHTWKTPFREGYCSNFTVVGDNPTIVNRMVTRAELFLGGRDVLFLPTNLNSFSKRFKYLWNWLLKGENI